jgi:hypothetical protein
MTVCRARATCKLRPLRLVSQPFLTWSQSPSEPERERDHWPSDSHPLRRTPLALLHEPPRVQPIEGCESMVSVQAEVQRCRANGEAPITRQIDRATSITTLQTEPPNSRLQRTAFPCRKTVSGSGRGSLRSLRLYFLRLSGMLVRSACACCGRR